MSQAADLFRHLDADADDGRVLAQVLNARFDALLSEHAGPLPPPYAVTGTRWLDTSVTPHVLRLRILGQWTALGYLDPATTAWTPSYLASVLTQATAAASAQAVAAGNAATQAIAAAAAAAAIINPGAYARSIGGIAYRNILGIVCDPSFERRAKDSEGNALGVPTGMTFSRASVAYRCNALGLLEQVPAGALRHDYHPVTGEYLGWQLEPGRTNNLLWCRDLAQAAWVASGMTVAKDQAGADGVANSASSLLATSAGATVLQAVTAASGLRATSAYIKRLIGTGAVSMTTDGGATWVDVTALLTGAGPGGYARVTIPSQTLANPSVGVRVATAGDQVALDFIQSEVCTADAGSSSPILTTSAPATRAADQLSISLASIPFHASEGTMLATWDTAYPGVNVVSVSDATLNNRLALAVSPSGGGVGSAVVTSAGVAQASLVILAGPLALNSTHRTALAWRVNAFAACGDGGTVLTDTAGDVPQGLSTLEIGRSAMGSALIGHVRHLCFWPRRLADIDLQNLTR